LEALPHVETIRIHTRVPVAEPARITPAFARSLNRTIPIWVSLHCNHPKELAADAQGALKLLGEAGVPLLAQTVLLKGVNDDAVTLEALFRALIACRVKPYYLHHPDLAPGTAKFRPSIEHGRSLMRALRGRLPGHALPTYVLDIPDGAGKVPIGPDYVDVGADGGTVIVVPRGDRHEYPARPVDAD
jgi:lysine 2,3-aminomutase